jgi:transcriptional regulator with XRE-family HTH domain
MATEFTVILEDRPGTLAQLGIVLGDATVNIEAIHGTSREGAGLSSLCPMTRSYIGRLETGHYDPKLSTLRKLAKALGVPVTVLLE